MTHNSTVTFQTAIKDTAALPRAALLGNGFSIAYSRGFNYSNLYDKATLDSAIRAIFERLETSDFEQAICWLEDNVALLGKFGASNDLVERLQSKRQIVRFALIDAIKKSHPKHVHKLDTTEKEYGASFLRHFDTIFSINYDLLLYWLKISMNLEDGFRNAVGDPEGQKPLVWYPQKQPEVFWLHGGFHLFDNEQGTFKYRYDGTQLIEQLDADILSGNIPLVVAEGRSDRKLNRILEHDYLRRSYEELRNFDGALFVYGLALQKQDDHILDALVEGQCSLLYVSLFHGDSTAHQSSLIGRANDLTERRSRRRDTLGLKPSPLLIHFYDASSCEVWRPRGQPSKP